LADHLHMTRLTKSKAAAAPAGYVFPVWGKPCLLLLRFIQVGIVFKIY
jgi:hypothetical protein